MIERDQRPDVGLEQGIDQAAVIIDAFGICRAGAGRLNAGPGDRKTVAVQVHRLHQSNVFAPAMIGIARHIAGVAVLDFARSVREAVPDGLAFAVFVPGAFNLVSGGGCAPEESLGKCGFGRWVELVSRHGGWNCGRRFGRSAARRESGRQSRGRAGAENRLEKLAACQAQIQAVSFMNGSPSSTLPSHQRDSSGKGERGDSFGGCVLSRVTATLRG